ncbi:hypothetical protein C5B96_01680 [Subtercola sp. Z020]|uniref:hypothetical protein n=1 Tax=Subtercola sp. Z020 TaxID=2080582 RepID=UPI000CE90261|nr:hypothetical protein [Subtercola sp. Z020]PPF89616.1 hypothetical protein C5B96_01680 [Subtercola sp. Z020]
MTAVDELRAMAAIVLAISLPVALVLFAVWNATRPAPPSPSGSGPNLAASAPAAASTPYDDSSAGRVGTGRLLAWVGGCSLAATAVLLLLA